MYMIYTFLIKSKLTMVLYPRSLLNTPLYLKSLFLHLDQPLIRKSTFQSILQFDCLSMYSCHHYMAPIVLNQLTGTNNFK